MRNARIRTLLVAVASLIAVSASADEQKSFMALMAKGFEIKSRRPGTARHSQESIRKRDDRHRSCDAAK